MMSRNNVSNSDRATQDSPSLLKERLERRYKSFVDLDDTGFFRGVANYVEVIIRSHYLIDIVNEDIRAEENERIKKIDKLTEHCEKELEEAGKKLLHLIKKNKINSKDIHFSVNEYKRFKNDEVSYADYYQVRHFKIICNIIRVLKTEGFKKIADSFTDGSGSDLEESYNFSSKYQHLVREIDKYKQRRETETWGSWQKIWLIYMIIHESKQLDEMIEDPSNTSIKLANALELIVDPQNILTRNPKEKLLAYVKGFYIEHVDAVHHHLLDKVEAMIKTPTAGDNVITFPIDRDYTYEQGELHLRTQDGSPCSLDLTLAKKLRPIFESFYYLFRDGNKKHFERVEIKEKYRELTGKDIDWETLIDRKCSIVGKKINPKPCLRNRIIWEYDKKKKMYQFEILRLSDK